MGLWMFLIWLVPLVLAGLPDVVGVVIGLAVLGLGLTTFFWSLLRLHRQMVAVKAEEIALARELLRAGLSTRPRHANTRDARRATEPAPGGGRTRETGARDSRLADRRQHVRQRPDDRDQRDRDHDRPADPQPARTVIRRLVGGPSWGLAATGAAGARARSPRPKPKPTPCLLIVSEAPPRAREERWSLSSYARLRFLAVSVVLFLAVSVVLPAYGEVPSGGAVSLCQRLRRHRLCINQDSGTGLAANSNVNRDAA
jgi:hypothetical protein